MKENVLLLHSHPIKYQSMRWNYITQRARMVAKGIEDAWVVLVKSNQLGLGA